jgi:hypothetical protein
MIPRDVAVEASPPAPSRPPRGSRSTRTATPALPAPAPSSPATTTDSSRTACSPPDDPRALVVISAVGCVATIMLSLGTPAGSRIARTVQASERARCNAPSRPPHRSGRGAVFLAARPDCRSVSCHDRSLASPDPPPVSRLARWWVARVGSLFALLGLPGGASVRALIEPIAKGPRLLRRAGAFFLLALRGWSGRFSEVPGSPDADDPNTPYRNVAWANYLLTGPPCAMPSRDGTSGEGPACLGRRALLS